MVMMGYPSFIIVPTQKTAALDALEDQDTGFLAAVSPLKSIWKFYFCKNHILF